MTKLKYAYLDMQLTIMKIYTSTIPSPPSMTALSHKSKGHNRNKLPLTMGKQL